MLRSPATLLVALALAALSLPFGTAVAAAATPTATPAQVAAVLNAERRHNGLPAGLTTNADWGAKCRLHDAWMARNKVFAHEETPGTPGYTTDGNWAGTNAVLAEGGSFLTGDPYDDAPYHLLQLLHPRLRSFGADESQGYGCVTTFPGFDPVAPAVDQLWMWPGNGRRDAPWFEQARELPSVPGDLVGLREGAVTGPNIMVYWDGPTTPDTFDPTTGARIAGSAGLDVLAAATLHGPYGVVPTKVVNSVTSEHTLDGAGFVIPVRPLLPGTSYSIDATFVPRPDATCATLAPATCRSFTGTMSFHTRKLSTLDVFAPPVVTRTRYRGRPAVKVAITQKRELPGYARLPVRIDGYRYTVQPGGYVIATVRAYPAKVVVRVPSTKVGATRLPAVTFARTVR